MKSVLVLNASFEPLHRVSIQHAIRMIVREVAVIEEATDEMFGSFPMPAVLRLVKYIRMHWRKPIPKWSKRRLMERDNHKCGYCGKSATTVDHVYPRILGGQTTWLNTISACFKCNNKKGAKTLEQSGMKFLYPPFEPSWHQISR